MIAAKFATVYATVGHFFEGKEAKSENKFLASNSSEIEQEYARYVAQYGKNYLSTEEYNFRMGIFAESHQAITEHNQSGASYTLGHNKFSDMTKAERRSLNGLSGRNTRGETLVMNEDVALPESIDWRKKLASVRHVKDQGQCGSCWAFSSTGCMEAAREIAGKGFTPLSEQQLVDCSHIENAGCDGGLQEDAFDYEVKYGSESEAEYPYEGVDGKCRYQKSKVVAGDIKSWHHIPSGNNKAMKQALTIGPVSISVEADQDPFQFYESGVVAADGKCGNELDHAVLAVGYGHEQGKEYLLVKNSWGYDWGENGFIKLEMKGNKSACGCLDDNLTVVIA